jgi:hypothetical protein
MITKTAMVGLAHFLMQADPITAQHVLNQLPVQESEQMVQFIEAQELKKSRLPDVLAQKIWPGGNPIYASPSHETSTEP